MQTQQRIWTSVQQYNVVTFVVSVCLSLGFSVGIVGGAPSVDTSSFSPWHADVPLVRAFAAPERACAWNDRVYTVTNHEQLASVAAYSGLTTELLQTYNRLTDAFSASQRICVPDEGLQTLSGVDRGEKKSSNRVAGYRKRVAAPMALTHRDTRHKGRRAVSAAPAHRSAAAASTSARHASRQTAHTARQTAHTARRASHRSAAHSNRTSSTSRTQRAARGTSNAFPYGQCTWWATQRYHQLHHVFVPWSFNADAGKWVDRARQYRWHVSSVPKVGAILVLQGGVQGAARAGHVGVVEQVNKNGTVTASSMNWGGRPGTVTRTRFYVGSGVSFISL